MCVFFVCLFVFSSLYLFLGPCGRPAIYRLKEHILYIDRFHVWQLTSVLLRLSQQCMRGYMVAQFPHAVVVLFAMCWVHTSGIFNYLPAFNWYSVHWIVRLLLT